jgi:serine/threonine protein kinase
MLYTAPEIIKQLPYGPEIDIWGLGILCTRPPACSHTTAAALDSANSRHVMLVALNRAPLLFSSI